jgi:hypothetical protein
MGVVLLYPMFKDDSDPSEHFTIVAHGLYIRHDVPTSPKADLPKEPLIGSQSTLFAGATRQCSKMPIPSEAFNASALF